ncbi:MAG: long-chain-fatty-acid--CoA ligase [Chloroflexi bacterium]|nr:long-chain-fatty-acid--CoA ligase [Chloroflexota bacterium]
MREDGRVWRSELTPLAFLERSANVFRERTAVIDGDRRYSYAELGERVNRQACALRDAGVGRNDRVAILSANAPPMLEAHYGVPMAGAILVPINIRLSADEVAYILDHSGARLLLAGVEFAPLVAEVYRRLDRRPPTVWLSGQPDGAELPETAGDGDVAYERFLQRGSPAPFPWSLDPDEGEDATISINYTSGTTGRPKGVMYHHRGAYLNALGEIVTTGLATDSIYLWTLPMFHCDGWCFPWAVVAAGGTQMCLRAFDPARVWRLIREAGVTHFCGAPTVLISLVNHPAAREGALDRPLRVTTAAAPPSPTIIGQMEALGATITHVYGLTETYGPHTVCAWHPEWDALPLETRVRLKARQGVAYVIADPIRVVDEEGRDVPADGQTMGEVVMRGNNVMKGYYRDPEATARAFRGGYFHSGDLGVMHPDGYIELRDRAKDIIISGGENISTIEVEQIILQHPGVLECAVIGVPHPHWGETPKAYVVPRDGAAVDEAEIIAFCRERIAHFKAPRSVEFGELPKTSTGKIQKFVLRDREWAAQERRIH